MKEYSSRSVSVSSAKQLGQALRVYRRQANATQKQLADYCNLSHNGISQIERGHKAPNLNTVLKLTRMLGVSVVLVPAEEAPLEYEALEQALARKLDRATVKAQELVRLLEVKK